MVPPGWGVTVHVEMVFAAITCVAPVSEIVLMLCYDGTHRAVTCAQGGQRQSLNAIYLGSPRRYHAHAWYALGSTPLAPKQRSPVKPVTGFNFPARFKLRLYSLNRKYY